jgi:hypothetical protein
MKYMAALWRMEVDLRLGYINDAKAIAALLGGDAHIKEADKAFKTYCMSMHLRPLLGYGNFSCIDQRIAHVEKTTVNRERPTRPQQQDQDIDIDIDIEEPQPITEEVEVIPERRPNLSGALNILVISVADTQDAGGGISYYMRQKGIRHRVSIAKEFRDGDWDYIIDLDNEELIGGTYSIDFKPDVSAQVGYLGSSDRLASCVRVLIGVGGGLDRAANELRTQLTDRRMLVATSRLTDISQSSVMRERLKEWESERFCVIGMGNENEMNVFIPTVRSYIVNPRKQTVYVIQPVDTGRNYTRGYERYYRNSYIYPSIELTLSEDMQIFATGYESFSGRAVTYQTVLGYDMMHYIHLNTQEGSRDRSGYLTNIAWIENDRVARSVIGFRIDNRGNVEQLVFDMRSVDEPEEMTGVGIEFEHE